MELTVERVLEVEESKKLVNKNIILFLMGKLVSLFGSSMYSYAMGLYILSVTGSGLSFAFSLVVSYIPRAILSPFAGVVADKFDRKKMIVSLDILSGIIVMALVAVSWFNGLKVGYIYVTTLLLNTVNIFFNNIFSASTPNLVDDENLTKINSYSTTIQQSSNMIGVLLGGMIFALIDIKIFLIINGVSFIISGISEIFIDFNIRDKIYKKQEKEEKKVAKGNFKEDFITGIKYIRSQKWLVVLGVVVTFANMLFTMGMNVPVPYIVKEMWKVSDFQYSLIMTSFPVGMILASVIIGAVPQAKKNFKRLIIAMFVFGIGSAAVGVVASGLTSNMSNLTRIIMMVMVFITMAIASAFLNIPMMVTFQKLIPNEMLGRTMGALNALGALLMPVGALLSGVLIEVMDPWLIPFISGIIMILLTFITSKNKEIRTI